MRFTESKDGVERCTVVVRLRLTREEFAAARWHARRIDTTPHDVIAGSASLGVEGDVWEWLHEMKGEEG